MFRRFNEFDWVKLKKQIKEFLSNRLVIIGSVLMFLMAILVHRLFVIQILEGEEHQANFDYKVEKNIELSGSRGNIYDCKGQLLAYNQLAYTVTLSSTDRTGEIARKRSLETGSKVTENDVRNEIIYNLIKLLERNGDKINYDLPLQQDSKGKLRFTETGSSLTRFKKEIYSITNLDNLTGDDREKAERMINSSPEEVYEYLRQGTNGPAGSGDMFGISDAYSMEDTLKIMSIRYDSFMNRYSQTRPITVASNISDESIAAISEDSSEFPGVEIEADSLRKYNDAKYFSAIIGYTGIASESELDQLNSNGGDYAANDVIGKTGIEQAMESQLKGKKGYQKVLVDNLGKVIKVVETSDSSVGNDIYLTIDADLQKYAYNILERRLAGIILAHLTQADEGGTDKMIPVKDVYFALIDNNVIDVEHLAQADASNNEKKVYRLFKKKQDKEMDHIQNILLNGKTILENMNEEDLDYVDYVYHMLTDEEILITSEIPDDDETYSSWKNGKLSFRDFLRYAINNEWIDIDSFEIDSDYYNANEIYNELVANILEKLKTEEDFDKLLYKYMIMNGDLKGKQVCLLLYDQGVLDKEEDKDYNSLKNNELSAYNFIYNKIENIEITPAQLALDPCSGSVIITDPVTGQVRAMVSYPSYDNNRLANGIDSQYYAKLNADKSSPMLNRCTQTRTAPGSTFKPISATAVLEEELIGGDTYVKCTGVFDKITPAAKCWIYPNGTHGQLNVSGAIAVSCNYFFYTMGYDLGTVDGTYHSDVGLSRLRKYAALYGLDRKSGLEISEYEPRISDEDAVRSAIGQGTHSYTPSQISRYLTSLVNEEKLVELSLVDKTMDSKGQLVSGYEKRTDGNLNVSEESYRLIKVGMQEVVYGKNSTIKSLYEKQGLKVAGKTGTAQENKNRPNHALFVSYAPFDTPEITMTVVVPNGYTSTNAAEIARDIYRFYFGKTDQAERDATKALIPSGSDGSND